MPNNAVEKKIADISHYDGVINWELARQELAYVIFRASVGSNADKKYVANTRDCGIPYGAYHYVKAATADDARTEARWFVECANKALVKPNLYFLDIEYEAQTKANTKEICLAFLNELRKLGCKRVGLYIGQGKYPWIKSIVDQFDCIWIPRYGKDTGEVPPEEYYPIYPCDLWQYTSKGHINGIDDDVDLDILHGDKPIEWFTQEEKFETPLIIELLMKLIKKIKSWFGVKDV